MDTQEPDYSDEAAQKAAEEYLKKSGVQVSANKTSSAFTPPQKVGSVAPKEDLKEPNPYMDFPAPQQAAGMSPLGVAAAGAGAGMALRAVGVNPTFKSDLFKPTENPHADAINAKIRQATGIADFDINKISSTANPSVQRMVMGKTDELGNTGSQNMSINDETRRQAQHFEEKQNMLNKMFPNLPNAWSTINEAMARTPSGISVPARAYEDILAAQNQAKLEESNRQADEINRQVDNIMQGHNRQQARAAMTNPMARLGASGLGGGLMTSELSQESHQPGGLAEQYGHPLTNPVPYLNQIGNAMIYGGGPGNVRRMLLGTALKAPYYLTHGNQEIENLKKAYPETTQGLKTIFTAPKGGLPTDDQYDYSAAAP